MKVVKEKFDNIRLGNWILLSGITNTDSDLIGRVSKIKMRSCGCIKYIKVMYLVHNYFFGDVDRGNIDYDTIELCKGRYSTLNKIVNTNLEKGRL